MALFKQWIAVLLSMVLLMLSIARADFILEVEFYSYQNPSHAALDFNGACCDHSSSTLPPNCTNMCDNYFFICLRNASDTRDLYVSQDVTNIANDSCPYGWIVTDQLARNSKDDVRFTTGSLDHSQQTPNPVVFECSSPWPGAVELVIVVVDDDSNIDDVIDIVSVQVTNPSPTEGSNPTLGDINYYIGMAGFSYIELSYVVNCSKDFYGSDCDMFCVPRNNTFGHFTCNETSGSIICNEGYSNTSVWCTQCVPADTCSPIGGFCEEPGDCICRDGFHGENCTEATQQTKNSSSSLGPPIGGTITGIIILAAIGTIVIIATVGELRKRKKRSDFKKKQRGTRNSELLSNAAYIKTRVQIQDKHHEEFETSHNPGYRAVSLARQQAHIISSYPGAHPSHYVDSHTSHDCQNDDLYYYSYPRTSPRLVQLNQGGSGVGIYSLEGPHSGDEESDEHRDFETNGNEDEYMYVSTEYVNGYSISPQGWKNHALQTEPPVKKLKPVPLPRTKKTSVPEA